MAGCFAAVINRENAYNSTYVYSPSSQRIALEASVMISLQDNFGSRNCSDLTNPSFSMFGDFKATSLLSTVSVWSM